jgi:hypothetical protein
LTNGRISIFLPCPFRHFIPHYMVETTRQRGARQSR